MKFTKINNLKIAGAALLVTASLVGGASVAGASSTTPVAKAAPRTPYGGTAVSVAPGVDGYSSVACPAGKILTGGGGSTSGVDIYVTDSYPSGSSWVFRGINRGTIAESITPYAVCIG